VQSDGGRLGGGTGGKLKVAAVFLVSGCAAHRVHNPPKSGENRGTRSARYQFAKVVASFIRTCAMFTKRGTQCRYQIGQILNKTGLISRREFTVVIVTPAEDGTRRGWSAAHPD
jgi:hypothetical protein